MDEEVTSVKFVARKQNEQIEEDVVVESPLSSVVAGDSPKTSKSAKSEQEFQRLKSLVTIPYLPPVIAMEDRPVYTLVLDLDETLIHLECDDEEN